MFETEHSSLSVDPLILEMVTVCLLFHPLLFLYMVTKDFAQAVTQGSYSSGESSHFGVSAEIDVRTSGLEATI